MSELKFKKIGAGISIKDKDGKGFGSIKNKPSADKLGNKVEIRTNKPIPLSITKQMQNERIKKGLLTEGQIKLAKKNEKNPVHKLSVKNMTEAKKLVAKILKVGGSSRDGPVTQIQEKLLIRKNKLK